jgi:hypothetical protein
MTHYNVEHNIHFYDELQKALQDNTNVTSDAIECCLISGEPLTHKHVQMTCGHKFNYIPLYYDLVNHKKKFNKLEGMKSKCKINEIRCPYCRHTQRVLLPYYEELHLNKEFGVNVPEIGYIDSKDRMIFCCSFQLEDRSICSQPKSTQINVKFNSGYTNFGDSNYYCKDHKQCMISVYRKQRKEALKMQYQIDTELCQEILTAGPNKGKLCCTKVYKHKLCKRHYNAKKKSEEKDIQEDEDGEDDDGEDVNP